MNDPSREHLERQRAATVESGKPHKIQVSSEMKGVHVAMPPPLSPTNTTNPYPLRKNSTTTTTTFHHDTSQWGLYHPWKAWSWSIMAVKWILTRGSHNWYSGTHARLKKRLKAYFKDAPKAQKRARTTEAFDGRFPQLVSVRFFLDNKSDKLYCDFKICAQN